MDILYVFSWMAGGLTLSYHILRSGSTKCRALLMFVGLGVCTRLNGHILLRVKDFTAVCLL